MKIRRPEEESGGDALTGAELSRCVAEAAQARSSSPAGRAAMRSFYQAAAWFYTESFQLMISTPHHPDVKFDSASHCAESAIEAADAGFAEEAAALTITAARLAHRAYSLSLILSGSDCASHYTGVERKEILLTAFLSLSLVQVLPGDDAEYWQDRLAEVAAALFAHVGAFDYRGERQHQAAVAVEHVAKVIADLAPYRPSADLK